MGNKNDKKVFIVQPMLGRTDEEIKSERALIIDKLTRAGYDVIESFIDDAPMGCVHEGVYYLGKSLEYLSWADYIYLCDGWESGRGCQVEREVAMEYEIPEVIL